MKDFRTVPCPYCTSRDAQVLAELQSGSTLYPNHPETHNRNYWVCPSCKAYVGCHQEGDGTRPLGTLANAALREARLRAHAAFDPLWERGPLSRTKAYQWLADKLGINFEHCHIGQFDTELCLRVEQLSRGYHRPKRSFPRLEQRRAQKAAAQQQKGDSL